MTGWLERAAELPRGARGRTRSKRSYGVGPTVATSLAAYFGPDGPGGDVLRDLAAAGVEPELPEPRPAGADERAAGRQDASW